MGDEAQRPRKGSRVLRACLPVSWSAQTPWWKEAFCALENEVEAEEGLGGQVGQAGLPPALWPAGAADSTAGCRGWRRLLSWQQSLSQTVKKPFLACQGEWLGGIWREI